MQVKKNRKMLKVFDTELLKKNNTSHDEPFIKSLNADLKTELSTCF